MPLPTGNVNLLELARRTREALQPARDATREFFETTPGVREVDAAINDPRMETLMAAAAPSNVVFRGPVGTLLQRVSPGSRSVVAPIAEEAAKGKKSFGLDDLVTALERTERPYPSRVMQELQHIARDELGEEVQFRLGDAQTQFRRMLKSAYSEPEVNAVARSFMRAANKLRRAGAAGVEIGEEAERQLPRAIKIRDRVFVGKVGDLHDDVLRRAAKELKIKDIDDAFPSAARLESEPGVMEFGFVNPNNREFIRVDEAEELLNLMDQFIDEVVASRGFVR